MINFTFEVNMNIFKHENGKLLIKSLSFPCCGLLCSVINPSSLYGMYLKTIGLHRKHSPWGWNFTEYLCADDKHYFTVYRKSNVVLNLFKV